MRRRAAARPAPMIVRPATADDNAALLALAGTLSLPGIVRIGVGRAPDFFALDRALGGEGFAAVAVAEDRVIGFIDIGGIAVRVGARQVPAVQVSLAGM